MRINRLALVVVGTTAFGLVMLPVSTAAAANCSVTTPGRTLYSVKIDSAPQGAAVYINSKDCPAVGVTPWEGRLNNSDYTLIVEADGYEPVSRPFKVARLGTQQVLSVPLVKKAEQAAASAQPTHPQPWVVGVTAEQKAAAQQHLDAGNALFLEHKYAEALEEYKKATAAWDHPAIRFNIVRCLIFLERPLEASDNLKLALKYGAAPFDESIYNEALAYEKLLASEVGQLDINCDQPGVQLTMDGQHLISCPGKEERRVLPGQHQIVGKKDGFVPRTVEVVVLGGKHEHAALMLDPLSKVARIEHKWPTWIPWTVIGGGFVLAGIGGLIRLKAAADNSSYANIIAHDCPDGCPSTTIDHSLENSAILENEIAIGVMAAGAAVVVTGGLMLYINRGHTVYDLGKDSPSPRGARLDVVPMRSGAAVSLSGRF